MASVYVQMLAKSTYDNLLLVPSKLQQLICKGRLTTTTTTTTTTILPPFSGTIRASLCQKRHFWTLWCKGRLTQAYIRTVRLGATPSGLNSAHLHHPLPPPHFLQTGCSFCHPTNSVKALKVDSHQYYNLLSQMCSYIKISKDKSAERHKDGRQCS